jgi:hypothetical protein
LKKLFPAGEAAQSSTIPPENHVEADDVEVNVIELCSDESVESIEWIDESRHMAEEE